MCLLRCDVEKNVSDYYESSMPCLTPVVDPAISTVEAVPTLLSLPGSVVSTAIARPPSLVVISAVVAIGSLQHSVAVAVSSPMVILSSVPLQTFSALSENLSDLNERMEISRCHHEGTI